MALGKVRALHPDFFSDDDLAEVSIPARLLFAGLWCYACDNGHLPDRSKQIKRWIYATDDVNVAELLRELDDIGVIHRVDGWIYVNSLTKRQRIDKRYFKTCDKPDCARPETTTTGNPERETRRAPAGRTAGTRRESEPRATKPVADGDGDVVRDGDGDGDSSLVATSATARKRATKRPDTFRPSQNHIDLAASRGVDLRFEWAKFCDYCDANGKTYKDWDAALRNWIRNVRVAGHDPHRVQPSRVQQHLALAAELAAEEHPQIGDAR